MNKKECHKCGDMFDIKDTENLDDIVSMESICDGGDLMFVWLCPACREGYDDESIEVKEVDP